MHFFPTALLFGAIFFSLAFFFLTHLILGKRGFIAFVVSRRSLHSGQRLFTSYFCNNHPDQKYSRQPDQRISDDRPRCVCESEQSGRCCGISEILPFLFFRFSAFPFVVCNHRTENDTEENTNTANQRLPVMQEEITNGIQYRIPSAARARRIAVTRAVAARRNRSERIDEIIVIRIPAVRTGINGISLFRSRRRNNLACFVIMSARRNHDLIPIQFFRTAFVAVVSIAKRTMPILHISVFGATCVHRVRIS